MGDRGAKKQAQDVTRPNGKIHRIHKDGTIPKNILNEKISVCRIGYGCAVRPDIIRSGNLFNGKIGTITIKNNNYFTEINLANFDDLNNKFYN